MVSLLLPIIYIAFISLGLPDSLLGSAWPTMYPELGVPVSCAGILSMIISLGTILSSLQSDRLTRTLGTGRVTAISVGMTDAGPVLDLDYVEDSSSDTDMNVVMTGEGRFVEIQGTAEGAAFSRAELDELLRLAEKGNLEIMALQRAAFE